MLSTEATALKGIIWIASNITGGVRSASGSAKDDRENITHAIKLKRFFISLLLLSLQSRNLWWMTLKHEANLVWKVSHHSGSFKRHIINSVDLNANSSGNKSTFSSWKLHSPPVTILWFLLPYPKKRQKSSGMWKIFSDAVCDVTVTDSIQFNCSEWRKLRKFALW